MGKKQRAIKLNLNRTFEEKKFPCDRNIIKDGKNEALFEPACVFTEEKRKFLKIFGGKARNLIFFVEGARNALRFGETTDKMNPFWTMEEAEEFIEKEIAKSLAKYKPMTWGQFIIVLIPILACFILLLKIAFYFGVF